MKILSLFATGQILIKEETTGGVRDTAVFPIWTRKHKVMGLGLWGFFPKHTTLWSN